MALNGPQLILRSRGRRKRPPKENQHVKSENVTLKNLLSPNHDNFTKESANWVHVRAGLDFAAGHIRQIQPIQLSLWSNGLHQTRKWVNSVGSFSVLFKRQNNLLATAEPQLHILLVSAGAHLTQALRANIKECEHSMCAKTEARPCTFLKSDRGQIKHSRLLLPPRARRSALMGLFPVYWGLPTPGSSQCLLRCQERKAAVSTQPALHWIPAGARGGQGPC